MDSRIDGHTDKIPINNENSIQIGTSNFKSNKYSQLFCQARIPPHRLVAAGFGENYPLSKEENEESYRKNRRIEIKLTTR